MLIDSNLAGTLDNPIVVNSAGDEQFAGCTGYPADSHVTIWLNVSSSLSLPTSPSSSPLPQHFPLNSSPNPLYFPHTSYLPSPFALLTYSRCRAIAPSNAASSAAASTAWNTLVHPTTRMPTTSIMATEPIITWSRRRLRIL